MSDVIHHADDSLIVADASLAPVLEKIAQELKTIRQCVVMCDGAMPLITLRPVTSYEELIASESASFERPRLDEHDIAFPCYT